MNSLFRAIGAALLRHEVHTSISGRSAASQGRTRAIECRHGRAVRLIQRTALALVHWWSGHPTREHANAVLCDGAARTRSGIHRPRTGPDASRGCDHRFQRRSICLIGISAASLFLAACGGGEADTQNVQATPAPPPAPAAAKFVRIQLFGDSTVDQEAAYWQSKWPGHVISNAVGGTTSAQLRAGTDGSNLPWPNSVDDTADYVVIGHGANDSTYAAGSTVEQFKDNLRFFARNAKHAKVIFMTPLPSTTPWRMDVLPPYAQAMRDVAKEVGAMLIDRDTCWRVRPDWQSLLYDGTHATPDGRQWSVANCAAPVIEPLLAPRAGTGS